MADTSPPKSAAAPTMAVFPCSVCYGVLTAMESVTPDGPRPKCIGFEQRKLIPADSLLKSPPPLPPVKGSPPSHTVVGKSIWTIRRDPKKGDLFTLLGVTGVHIINQQEEGLPHPQQARHHSQPPAAPKSPGPRPDALIPPFDGIAPPSKDSLDTLSNNFSTFANKLQNKVSQDFTKLTTNFFPRYIQSCQNTADLGMRVVVRAINKVADLFGRD